MSRHLCRLDSDSVESAAMILVTGAGGKTGRMVIRALAAKGEPVRAVVHNEDQVAAVERNGAQQVAVADLMDQTAMLAAMKGVRAVYFIAPNLHPEESRLGEIAIEVAKHAAIERFVYHSVLHPQTRAMPHHWQKLAVEERLLESGLDFVILQPSAYMQNILPYWKEILGQGAYRVPYGEAAALSLVDLEDVAEVAAIVLTTSDCVGGIYELAGPQALSPSQIAAVLSRLLAREIRPERVPVDTWADSARAKGLDSYPIEALVKMFEYYDLHGLIGSPNILEWLLGRQPTTFEAYLEIDVMPTAGYPKDSE